MPVSHKIKDNLVSPRFKNSASSSSSSSQLDTLDGNISDGNGSELTSRQEGASSVRDETAGLTKPKDKNPPVKWSVENEKILVEWCDVAVCYKWMHTKAHQKYSRSQAWYTIPAIVLSTISGTASFAQGNIPATYQPYAPLVIGTVNIFIGILTTIQQYLKISELNEGHRIAGISWDKFSRNIRIELAKDPNERMKAEPFLKMSRQEFDRLMETSPSIPPDIIKTFMTTFGMKDFKTGFDITKYSKLRLEKFESLIKPDVCDLLISSAENRHHWYQEFELVKVDGGVQTDLDSSMNDLTSGSLEKTIAPRIKTHLETRVEEDILKREEELRKKEQEVHDMEMQLTAEQKTKEALERKAQDKKKIEDQHANQVKLQQEKTERERIEKQMRQLTDYVSSFQRVSGRPPIEDEIKLHFGKTLDDAVMKEFLGQYVFTANV